MVYESEYAMDTDSNFRTLDDFSELIVSKDTNVRLEIFHQLEAFLRQPHSNLHCTDLNTFCSSILLWINSSNFKISINGLTIIQMLIQRLSDKLQNYTIDIVTHIVDRFGDSKDQVRVASKNILIFMMATYTPTFIWDRLNVGFNHKIPKIREETLELLGESFDKFGANNMNLPKMVTFVVKLFTDQNQFVREKALACLIEIYKTVGDRLRNELKKKQLPEEKLKLIFGKFDDVIKSGKMKECPKETHLEGN
ncbi:unnamed protein product [Brachionus calyciflorus]|uniref:TOG domain-containing protein n=1 Tax=Brachionus calyciflorus TaxID=104777 RepID=A0A813MBJ5_9BILA|nr:unnamed protein product [Brachionus calyciflorus]